MQTYQMKLNIHSNQWRKHCNTNDKSDCIKTKQRENDNWELENKLY